MDSLVFSLLFAILFTGAPASARDFFEIKAAILNSEIENQNYQLAGKLCYLYQFRKQNQLSLRNTDPLLEDQIIKQKISTDLKLADSLSERRKILIRSVGTVFNGADRDSTILLRNEKLQKLLRSPGFALAARECSEIIQADAKKLMTTDLGLGDAVMSNIGPMIVAGAALRGAYLAISSASTVGLNNLLIRIGIKPLYLGAGFTGALIAAPLYVAWEDAKERAAGLNSVKKDIHDGPSLEQINALERWAEKRMQMADLILAYEKVHSETADETTRQRFKQLLEYVKSVRPLLETKLKQLESCYSQVNIFERVRALKQSRIDGEYEFAGDEATERDLSLMVLTKASLEILKEQMISR